VPIAVGLETSADETVDANDIVGGIPRFITSLNNEFIRIEETGNGFEIARSLNGIEWEPQPVTGLPQQGWVASFDSTGDSLVAVLEVFPDYVDPYDIIFESGLLTNQQRNTLCDIWFDRAGEPIVGTVCDYEQLDVAYDDLDVAIASAETDEEIDAIFEAFYEVADELVIEEEILSLEPGDEFYDELVEAFEAQNNLSSSYVVATSSDAAIWVTAELPQVMVEHGYTYLNGAARSGDQLAVLIGVDVYQPDPFEPIYRSDLLDDDQRNEICNIEIDGPDDPIVVFVCDYDAIDAAYAELEAALDNAETDEEIDQIYEAFFELEQQLFEGDEVLRIEPGDELFIEVSEAFFSEPESFPPIVFAGPVGGALAMAELPVEGYASSIVGTNDGFLATAYDDNTGGTVVLRSADGVTWSGVERFEGLEDDRVRAEVEISANSEFALAIVVDFDQDADGNQSPVVLTSDDLGLTWSESELPTELFGVAPQTVAGPAGFATFVEGTTEPFIGCIGPIFVELAEGDFVMELELNEDIISLRTVDGVVIHESVSLSQAHEPGGIAGVVRVDDRSHDVIWSDPDTGEDLVVFLYDDVSAAIDAEFQAIEQGEFEAPMFVSEVWFSVDGQEWTLVDSSENGDNVEEFTFVAAVGDDEVLLVTESFPVAPDDLFLFEEEGRQPTPEEEAAINDFYNMGPTITQTRVVVG